MVNVQQVRIATLASSGYPIVTQTGRHRRVARKLLDNAQRGCEVTMKRSSFQIGSDFKATKVQLWSIPAVQVWEMLSLPERESLKRNAPAFGRACALS